MDKYGLIGYPLDHSFSPRIHNQAFEHCGLRASYDKIEIQPKLFNNQIKQLKTQHYRGFNITIPYKQKIIPYLNHIDEAAQKLQAVNTIKVSANGDWVGYNTDYIGFMVPFQKKKIQNKLALLIGAGGAAYAVVYALLYPMNFEKILILNRTHEKAREIRDRWSGAHIELVHQSQLENSGELDLIVNSTPVGMGHLSGMNSLPKIFSIKGNPFVYDLVYNPAKTKLLQYAESLGLAYENGLPMLIGQAEESFRIWTGHTYDASLKASIRKSLTSGSP
jgi:shikimate dehydrogenase